MNSLTQNIYEPSRIKSMRVTPQSVIQRAVNLCATNDSIDVIKLANSLGIEVYAKDTDEAYNSEIIFDKSTETFKIFVNSQHSLARQRFSIAHEIAHFVLHQDKVKTKGFLNREGLVHVDNKEMEESADQLAENILMPENLVKKYFKTNNIVSSVKVDEPLIQKIANQFRVSRLVAIIRLRHLNYYVPYLAFS